MTNDATGHNPVQAQDLAQVQERVLALAHLGIWRRDLETGRVTWSDELSRILGRDRSGPPPGGDPGDPIEAALHPADRSRYAVAMELAAHGAPGSAECRIIRPDGASARVRIAGERELDATGRLVALVGFVQLVVSVPDSTAPAAARRPVARPTPAAGVVLLVEDEDAVRTVLGRMLGGLGYSVFEASSGDEALELVGQGDDGIDLIVTDIRMPGISGPELAARIRSVRDVPVLFVSGYSGDLGEELSSVPHTHLLDKPFDTASLAAAIRTVLGAAD